MRAARRIAGNTGVIIAGKVLGLGLSLAIVLLLTGHLSVAEFGRYNFVFFYVGMFSVLVEMGMSAILVREMARDRQRAGEILGTGVLIKVALAMLSFLAALLVLPAVTLDRKVWKLVFVDPYRRSVRRQQPVQLCTLVCSRRQFRLSRKRGMSVALID